MVTVRSGEAGEAGSGQDGPRCGSAWQIERRLGWQGDAGRTGPSATWHGALRPAWIVVVGEAGSGQDGFGTGGLVRYARGIARLARRGQKAQGKAGPGGAR